MKTLLRRKLIALISLLKKLESSYMSNLIADQKALEQKVANTSKRSRLEKIIKIRVEINHVETKKTIQ